jgi:hypothetical protein
MPQSPLDWARETARHEHARQALERTLSECRRAGVDVLPVKGIVTARSLYADPADRPIRDVDLRVRPQDLERVCKLGARAGWRLVSRSRPYGTLNFEILDFAVEFECHVGPPGVCELRVDTMISRAARRDGPSGGSQLEPELHDHTLLLCVNAFKDKLVDAPQGAVRDLEILPSVPSFSCRRFVALAIESGATTIVWIVANWLTKERGSAAWGVIRDELGSLAPRPIYTFVFEWAVHSSHPRRRLLRLIARAGADRRSQRLLALTAMAFELIERQTRLCGT